MLWFVNISFVSSPEFRITHYAFRINLISDYPRPIFPCRLFGLVVAELIILSVFNLIGQVLLFDIMVRIAVRIEIILSFRQVALSVTVLVL